MKRVRDGTRRSQNTEREAGYHAYKVRKISGRLRRWVASHHQIKSIQSYEHLLADQSSVFRVLLVDLSSCSFEWPMSMISESQQEVWAEDRAQSTLACPYPRRSHSWTYFASSNVDFPSRKGTQERPKPTRPAEFLRPDQA